MQQILMLFLLVILLGLLLVFVGLMIFLAVRRKMKDFSRQAFGTDNLMDGLQQAQNEADNQPRSLSGGDSIYLPMILKDFPEYNVDVQKASCTALISAYLTALESGQVAPLHSFGPAIVNLAKKQLAGYGKSRPVFQHITFYQTTIARYLKSGYDCTVRFQSAFSYLDSNGCKRQCRAEVWDCYTLKDDPESSAKALRCGHCGAPVSGVGVKVCQYCGSGLVATMDKAWKKINLMIS